MSDRSEIDNPFEVIPLLSSPEPNGGTTEPQERTDESQSENRETQNNNTGGATNNQSNSNKDWYGVLYFFIFIKYKVNYFFWGQHAVTKPGPFNQVGNSKWLSYGGYNLKLIIKKFLKGPIKESEDLNFVEKLALLLEPGNLNDSVLQKSKDLTKLHRIHENTKARRRLEKWASRVIVLYLLIVLLLVLSNYISIYYSDWLSFMNKVSMDIPDGVMITILSTTTVNIIGLGLIVLRGHFLNKDDLKEESQKKNNTNNQNQTTNTDNQEEDD